MLSPQFLIAAGALAAPGVAGMIFGFKGVEAGEERTDSLWASEISPPAPLPGLEGERKADLAIIGGGYTGLSCAYYARKLRPEWSVVVLESHRLGSGASSRNSGAVYARYWGIDDEAMHRRGLERLMRFIEEEGIDCDLRPAPTIEVYTSKWLANRARASLAPEAKWIPAEELRAGAHTDYYSRAVELPGYYTIHPAKLVAGHVKAARGAGAELYENSPVLEVKRGKPVELVTPAGRVFADRVFIATNAYTPRLGFLGGAMLPVHQYTFATRKLTENEIAGFGLDRWPLRFERQILPVTNFLTPSGHFCIRIVLGYASHNSCQWRNIDGARKVAKKMFEQRYPWIADLGPTHGWHGVTGHTLRVREISGPLLGENIYASVAYNGLGVMPGHNNGYLLACLICGHSDEDVRHISKRVRQIPIPDEFYRSIMFKPFMKIARSD